MKVVLCKVMKVLVHLSYACTRITRITPTKTYLIKKNLKAGNMIFEETLTHECHEHQSMLRRT